MTNATFEVLAPSETTTIVRGTTVVLSSRPGEIRPNALLGVFYRDERLLSAVSVLVDGVEPPMLSSDRTGASSDRIALLAALDEYRNAQALLVRRRTVVDGSVTESIELHSFGPTKTVEVAVFLESDGASILRLKSGRAPEAALAWNVTGPSHATSERRGVPFASVHADGDPSLRADGTSLHITWKADIETGRVWNASWTVHSPGHGATHTDAHTDAKTGANAVAETPAETNDEPLGSRFHVEATDRRWAPALASAIADLDALIIELPERGIRFVGAGAPWYQALFGRDSLIAGWESLPLGTGLALDILDSLASLAGTETVARTREAPGKILHELRVGTPQVFGMQTGQTYFGSVDASPLFVMLLAEAYRWGAPVDRVRSLLPAARAALDWCLGDARRVDGHDRGPFVWYTPDPKGLGNQGWKDSGDCLVHSDGTRATGSLAVAEAQAYLFEALRGLARLERDLGGGDEPATALETEAANLSAAFVDKFWLADERLIALALDGAGDPLRVASSNMGQCLWSGIVPEALADQVAQRTMASDLLTAWGVRTLGSDERAYNPLGYHLGAVWAHDSAIIAAGLARHGFGHAFGVLCNGLLDAAERFGWRLPELYGGLDTAADGAPLPYPAACSPQAWSAGAPLLLLRSALGLAPDVPAGVVRLRPAFGPGEMLRVRGVRLGDESGEIAVDADGLVTMSGFTGLTLLT